jgi:hypothetical protein
MYDSGSPGAQVQYVYKKKLIAGGWLKSDMKCIFLFTRRGKCNIVANFLVYAPVNGKIRLHIALSQRIPLGF